MFTLIALAAAPIWVPILLIAYFNYKSTKETRKMKEAENKDNVANSQKAQNIWDWPPSHVKAQYLRNEYDMLIHRMFPGVRTWETPGEDVSNNYNGLHMTRLYYHDGTTKFLPIIVHATDTFIELYDESKDENETQTKPDVKEPSPHNGQKQDNEEEQADNWIKEHKDFMFQKLISETAFSLPVTDFPDSEKVISLILDKYSLSGKFSIYQDDEEQVIRFVPVLDDVIIEK